MLQKLVIQNSNLTYNQHWTDLGSEILREMLTKIATLTDKIQQQTFYKKYFMIILEHILGVLTDSSQVQFIGRILKFGSEFLSM